MLLEQRDEVRVFCHDHDFGRTRRGEDVTVCGAQQTQTLDMCCVHPVLGLKPARERGRQLRVNPDPQCRGGHLCGEHRVIEPPRGILQRRRDVLLFQIREVSEDFIGRLPSGEELENVDHTDTHAPDTGATATLVGVQRDPIEEVGHGEL